MAGDRPELDSGDQFGAGASTQLRRKNELPMAKRVLGAGHETFTTIHRRRQPADELAASGATVHRSAAEALGATPHAKGEYWQVRVDRGALDIPTAAAAR